METAMSASPVLLFLHIPKTGGSTLKSCISQALPKLKAEEQSSSETKAMGRLARFYKHGIFYYPSGFYLDPEPCDAALYGRQLHAASLRAVIGHFSYGLHQHISRRCRYVTFLRDPVERVLSLYYHQKANKILRESVTLSRFATEMSVADWNAQLGSWYAERPAFGENEIRHASRLMARNDQTRRIAGCHAGDRISDKAMLARARENLARFLFVGINEKFDESLMLLASTLGWNSLPNYFPRLINKVKASSTREAAALEAVRSANELDTELYAYACDRLERTLARQGKHFWESLEAFRKTNAAYQRERAADVEQWSLQ
jgi:hypothetical protein